jgi:hypothetical protein
MTMTAERPTKLIPLQQALAELDSPEAVADRKRRAKEMAKKLAGDARNGMIKTASREDLQKVLDPIYRAANRENWNDSTRAKPMPEAEKEAGHLMDALMPRLCEEHLRRTDETDLYRDADRLEEQRIWNAYATQVSNYAWRQGDKSDVWVRRWQQMIADRAAAEEYGDPVGAIDARLLRHVGIPYPQLPSAAWDTADVLPATERQAECDRLTAKYGPREPSTTPAMDAPKRRGRK